MKVAVIGSRIFTNYKLMENKLDKLHQLRPITEIVSGGATGADELSEVWAELNDIPTKIFLPNWDDISAPDAVVKNNRWGKPYDSKAGFRRNAKIAEYADIIVAFWDGKSHGTEDTLRKAQNLRVPGKVFTIDQNSKLLAESELILDNNS